MTWFGVRHSEVQGSGTCYRSKRIVARNAYGCCFRQRGDLLRLQDTATMADIRLDDVYGLVVKGRELGRSTRRSPVAKVRGAQRDTLKCAVSPQWDRLLNEHRPRWL
jgi:hypothetical protein